MAASAAMRAASVSGSGGGFEGGDNDDFEGGKIGGGARGRLYDDCDSGFFGANRLGCGPSVIGSRCWRRGGTVHTFSRCASSFVCLLLYSADAGKMTLRVSGSLAVEWSVSDSEMQMAASSV